MSRVVFFLQLIYNSLMFPFLTYGICGWGNFPLTFQRKILILQKRAQRLILSREHVVPLFIKSNCLLLLSLFLYSLIHNYRTRSILTVSFKLSSLGRIKCLPLSRKVVLKFGTLFLTKKNAQQSDFRKNIKDSFWISLQSEDDYVETPYQVVFYIILS